MATLAPIRGQISCAGKRPECSLRALLLLNGLWSKNCLDPFELGTGARQALWPGAVSSGIHAVPCGPGPGAFVICAAGAALSSVRSSWGLPNCPGALSATQDLVREPQALALLHGRARSGGGDDRGEFGRGIGPAQQRIAGDERIL